MSQFKLTYRTQLQALGGLMSTTTTFLVFFLLAGYYSESYILVFYSLFPFYLIFYLFPVIMLHINYLKYARNVSLNFQEKAILFNDERYDINQIMLVEIYSTLQRKKKAGSAYTLSHSEYYYYIKLNMKEGTPIILNSLLGQNIDHIMKKNYPSLNIQYRLHSLFGLMIYESSFTKN